MPATSATAPAAWQGRRESRKIPLRRVILNTERLLLRHFEPADLDPLHALYRDPEIRKCYPDGTRTLEETMQALEWLQVAIQADAAGFRPRRSPVSLVRQAAGGNSEAYMDNHWRC